MALPGMLLGGRRWIHQSIGGNHGCIKPEPVSPGTALVVNEYDSKEKDIGPGSAPEAVTTRQRHMAVVTEDA